MDSQETNDGGIASPEPEQLNESIDSVRSNEVKRIGMHREIPLFAYTFHLFLIIIFYCCIKHFDSI
jgi:hypothetical protein